MIKILETKKVALKFSDLEPGEVFIIGPTMYWVVRYSNGGGIGCSILPLDGETVFTPVGIHEDSYITEIVTKYKYTHDKQ